ncbi:hypothetical protein SAMD00019534_030990 [Acytostelium subglobosum LB1]|uniref:hypothetical protein n=1 Tax=Acytostelium subglobosum LB1 TaxID=1410327 RepID=UPI000644FFB9|nr:hypothetical protein SAMD00019534_030990 [Acytostelium subglobosum LB1]GAM19924.1 hypothetical protein SAMD00019534_030990 [Acytostelium subglobosum LB1]|eukprot:XP_012756686.1 hypothetical protein SAMD00019534_030990 [Acytostelium subglobosum LB1]
MAGMTTINRDSNIYWSILSSLDESTNCSDDVPLYALACTSLTALLRDDNIHLLDNLLSLLTQSLEHLVSTMNHDDHFDLQTPVAQKEDARHTRNYLSHHLVVFTLISSLVNKFHSKSEAVQQFTNSLVGGSLLTSMLLSHNIELRQSLINSLLPAVLEYGTPTLMFGSFVPILMQMMSITDHQIKSDAYKILTKQYSNFFTSPCDLRESETFWKFEILGFMDTDPLIRKRASYLLKRIIKQSIEQQDHESNVKWTEHYKWSKEESEHWQREWDRFFLINETIDEFNVHLIQPVWREIDQLVLSTNRIHFDWINILFQRVMNHENPAVVKAQVLVILNSDQYIPRLPMHFVFGTLIKAVTNPMLYRGITEDTINPALQHFFDTYYNSLDTPLLQGECLSQLLTFISNQVLYRDFIAAALAFLGRANQGRKQEELCFIDDSHVERILTLLESSRRMNHTYRTRAYKYIVEILVTLSIKDGLSFSNVCRLLYTVPIQTHTVAEYSALIREWLQRTGFSDANWLTNNITQEIAANNSLVGDGLVSDGDTFVRMKTKCYMLSRLAIYTSDIGFKSIVGDIISGITLNASELSNTCIYSLTLLSTILSNSISNTQAAQLRDTLSTNNFATTFIRYLINNDVVSNNQHIINNMVKLEFGDSLMSIVSFIIGMVEKNTLDEYVTKLITTKPSRSRSWKDQIASITLFQYFYGVFGRRVQLFSTEQLKQSITMLIPLSLQRPLEDTFDHGLNAQDWGNTLAYFMKIKWKCIRNLLTILSDSTPNGLMLLADNSKEMMEDIIDAVSGANRYSIKPIMNCAQLLLPFAIDQETGDYDVDTIERIVSSAYASANDTLFTSMTAFVQLAFCPALLAHMPSDMDGHNHHTVLQKYFRQVLTLSDTMVGLMNLLVMKCTPVWIERPDIALLYIDEIYLSLIFGPIRKEDDWDQSNDISPQFYDPIIGFSTFAFDMGVDAALENDVDEQQYGVGSIPLKDAFGRAVLATFIKKMGVLATSTGNYEFVNRISEYMIDINLTKEFTKKTEHLINTQPHRKRIRIWQALCLLANHVTPEDDDKLKVLGKKLLDIMLVYNLPSTRRYINIFIINMVSRFQSLVATHFIPLLDSINARGDIVTSIIVTVGNILLSIQNKEQVKIIFNKILAFCNSHHLSVRNAAIGVVMKMIETNKLEDKLDNGMLEYLKQMEWYIRTNIQTSKGLERLTAHLSIRTAKGEGCVDELVSATDYQNLYYDIPIIDKLATSEICAPGVFEFLVDEVILKSPLTFQLRQYLFEKSKLVLDMDNTPAAATTPPTTDQQQDMAVDNDVAAEDDITAGATITKAIDPDAYIEMVADGQVTGYQKKILPWNEIDDESRYNIMARERQRIIVVATFVDKIPNLAGLARTSEIFNVESLVVSRKAVMNDPMFQQISVSAERWLPTIEVEEKNLTTYLLAKKAEGYTLLGLEQTSTSSKLEEYKFPEKTVILLGKEKEGIPTEYINLLDRCIEIPQFGIIRSLNVHVSGSILMWEYTKQKLNSNK